MDVVGKVRLETMTRAGESTWKPDSPSVLQPCDTATTSEVGYTRDISHSKETNFNERQPLGV